MKQSAQVPTIILPNLLNYAFSYGIDFNQLLCSTGLPPNFELSDEAYISFADLELLIKKLLEEIGEPCCGLHFHESFTFDFLSEFNMFIKTAATARQAMKVIHWGKDLVCPFVDIETKEEGSDYIVSLTVNQPCEEGVRRFIVDALFSVFVNLARHHIGSPFKLTKVYLQSDVSSFYINYSKAFKAPIVGKTLVNSLVVPRELLDTPLNGVPQVHRHAQNLILNRLERKAADNSFQEVLRSWFSADTSRLELSLEEVSKQFTISTRNLQRKLAAEDSTFKSVQNEVKVKLARHLLLSTSKSISEIMELVRFSSRRNFDRAFFEYYQLTPRQYREKNH